MAAEEHIPITGLYGMKFLIVKINSQKYLLFRGERDNARSFIGTYATLDNVYDAVSRRCHKERSDKCQTKLTV